ncbi:MAG TPA: LacI family DNA-binding transcriptional regulator [Bryobacteraceae bacterium]|nr:LacI family DNA-binding transcriptional regulator [Bryobacteraceae bacterium]
MRGKITLQEIAVAARVSVATASRALNGTGQVSPEVARRVQAAVAKLRSAERPATRSHTICFLLANRSRLHPFHAQVLMGAQEFAIEQQNRILFYPFQYSPSASPDDIRLPLLLERHNGVDGYIVGGMNSENLLELLARSQVPFSVLGNNVLDPWKPEQYDIVWMDDRTGGYELTRYLQNLGHQAIWFVGSRRFPTKRVCEGYSQAMREKKLKPQTLEIDSDEERDIGYMAAKSLFAKKAAVTAIFGYNDAVAHGAYEAARASGLRIPEDISVVGVGDRPEASALTPSLTTLWAYPDQVGRRLAELVLKRIANPEAPPQQIVLPTRVIERNSCARVKAGKTLAAASQQRLGAETESD